jgi:hypothetical protein
LIFPRGRDIQLIFSPVQGLYSLVVFDRDGSVLSP